MKLKRFEAAEADLGSALFFEPANIRVHKLRAKVRLQLGRFEEAIADADAVLAQRPRDPSALEVRAMSQVALRRAAGAANDLTAMLGKPGDRSHAAPVGPHFGRLRAERAMLLIQLGRGAEAEQELQAIMTEGGKQALLRMQLYLRRHGFQDVPLDGQRTARFNNALKACFLDQACGRGLSQAI
jgi:hypothetical protein